MTREQLTSEPTQEITPEVRKEIRELMQTNGWETLEYLDLPATDVEFQPVERDLIEPEKATKIRSQTWMTKLEERKAVLEEANPENKYTIHEDENGNSALFEQLKDEEKCRMWTGTTVTLAQKGPTWEENKISIPVYPISYTEWIACYNPEYARVFQETGLPLPYAGIGVSVLMETTDGFSPLTRRGIETSVYPGGLYSPGGGPKPGETSTEAILSEILEETGLQRGVHFDPAKLTMLALVSDTHFADSEHARPELVAYLPLQVNYRTVETVQNKQSMKKGQRQEDVWGVVPISTFAPSLQRGIIYGGFEMCPPTEAGLAHVAFYLISQNKGIDEAFQQMEKFMKRLKSFERSIYTPPITRLPVVI